MTQSMRPELRLLTNGAVEKIVAMAWEILERTGVEVEHEQARSMAARHGFPVDETHRRIYFARREGEPLLRSVPPAFTLTGRDGRSECVIGGDRVHFDPGSAAVYWLDIGTGTHRRATSRDCRQLAVVTEALEMFPIQSTGIVPSDVPEAIADCQRLFFCLVFCSKPIVTGTFRKESFDVMRRMLEAAAGGPDALRASPTAIFDCCPSPPLRWSDLTLSALLDCARNFVPAEMVSMPLAGATSPVTLEGAVTQHAAECLSGALLHQMASPGAPIVWGGSPAAFDMRHGTPPMGAMETMMIDLACCQVGKSLGFPTHAYMACSDAKSPDYQAGMESGMGALLAALGGVNVVSGPGFLNYENSQSLEKLVLDNDACRLAARLVRGFATGRDGADPREVIGRHALDGAFLADPTTRRWHREEILAAGRTVNRGTVDEWEKRGRPSARDVARGEVERILAEPVNRLDDARVAALRAILIEAAQALHCRDAVQSVVDRELQQA